MRRGPKPPTFSSAGSRAPRSSSSSGVLRCQCAHSLTRHLQNPPRQPLPLHKHETSKYPTAACCSGGGRQASWRLLLVGGWRRPEELRLSHAPALLVTCCQSAVCLLLEFVSQVTHQIDRTTTTTNPNPIQSTPPYTSTTTTQTCSSSTCLPRLFQARRTDRQRARRHHPPPCRQPRRPGNCMQHLLRTAEPPPVHPAAHWPLRLHQHRASQRQSAVFGVGALHGGGAVGCGGWSRGALLHPLWCARSITF